MSALCRIDDKYVPLDRIQWVSGLPHFCGGEECQREGQYEVRLARGSRCGPTSSSAMPRWRRSNPGTAVPPKLNARNNQVMPTRSISPYRMASHVDV